ncbi:ankyrin repeat-containing domain protein, partial [Baffinella frigidus]
DEMARALVAAGSDKEAKNQNGFTPLHFAARGGSVGVVRALLDSGADFSAKNHDGYTP